MQIIHNICVHYSTLPNKTFLCYTQTHAYDLLANETMIALIKRDSWWWIH